jgi:hypothetical protein
VSVESWSLISSHDFFPAFCAFQKVNAASQAIAFHVLTFVLFYPSGCEHYQITYFHVLIFVFSLFI